MSNISEKKSSKTVERRIGEAGTLVVGGALGTAAASTAASVAGATAIPGVTAVASALGLTVVAATPVGWTIAAGLGGAAAAWGTSRLIFGGGKTEGRWTEREEVGQEKRRKEKHRRRADSVSEEDFGEFRNFIKKSQEENPLIEPRHVGSLLSHVRNGSMKIVKARSLIENLNVEYSESPVFLDSYVDDRQTAVPIEVDLFSAPEILGCMVFCEICGSPEDVRYCGACGVKLLLPSDTESPSEEQATNRSTRYVMDACHVCHTKMQIHCTHCGTSLPR